MKIDVIASENHYLRHMVPIWAALPDSLRGTVHPLYDQGAAQRPPMGRWALVAGWQDVSPLRGQCNMIYVEHGAGQTYLDRPYDPSYSASRGQRHRGVVGYIAPSQTVADRWDKPSIAVGCPKMDTWLNAPIKQWAGKVCFAFHWDCRMVPETRSAWNHYAPAMGRVANHFRQQGFEVFGHAHPKWRGTLTPKLDDCGITVWGDEDQVFEQADILIVDNSSLAYEFASLGRTVILLNAPWYRRDVEHGLRFWSQVPGLQIDEPDELLELDLWEAVHSPVMLEQRQRVTAEVYASSAGHAAEDAAAFIVELMSRE